MTEEKRRLTLVSESFPDRPAFDTAVSKALLKLVSIGAQRETLRLYRPGAIVAFGPQDASSEGFRQAVDAARECDFAAVLRLAGGRAAVFHQQAIAFSWTIPEPDPRKGIFQRFETLSRIMVDAFKSLNVDARVGEVKGEYCPGAYSVNARGQRKLMGVGQRLDARAAHMGGVVVVGASDRVQGVLIPVYKALNLDWDPSTAGSLQDEVPGLRYEDAEKAILAKFSATYDLVIAHLTPEALSLAAKLERDHVVA